MCAHLSVSFTLSEAELHHTIGLEQEDCNVGLRGGENGEEFMARTHNET